MYSSVFAQSQRRIPKFSTRTRVLKDCIDWRFVGMEFNDSDEVAHVSLTVIDFACRGGQGNGMLESLLQTPQEMFEVDW